MKQEYVYILKSFVVLIVVTFISNLFKHHLEMINITLIYIIPVVFVAVYGNLKITLFITFLSVIIFNFLFIPPLYSFNINNELYFWSFIIYTIVGWVVTVQAKNLDNQKRENELKESLLNIISHDLRTPLATIHGTTNLLLSNRNLEEKQKRNLLEDINYASLRMKRLITNILDSTRLTNKDFALRLEWCDFEDIVGVAIEEFSQKQVDVLETKIDDMTLFWGDNALLTQLMINLLDNAFKYSTQNTQITLEIRNLTNFIKINISNQSENIDKNKLKNIFDKFYRLEDTNDIEGSGIGLAICKSIVKLHNGEIKANQNDNKIDIEIILPIIKKVQLS